MKGKFVRNTLVFCLALALVIAMSSCTQPVQLLEVKPVDSALTVSSKMPIETWKKTLVLEAIYSDGTVKSIPQGDISFGRSIGSADDPYSGSCFPLGNNTIKVWYTVDGIQGSQTITVRSVPAAIPEKIEFSRGAAGTSLTTHDYVWFQSDPRYALPEGASNTIFNPKEFYDLYVTVEFSDGTKYTHERMIDLIAAGYGTAEYAIINDDVDKTEVTISAGQDLSRLQREGFKSGAYDLKITYIADSFNPSVKGDTSRAIGGADKDGLLGDDVLSEHRASVKFEDNILVNFYYPVVFNDHSDIKGTVDAAYTTALTLPTTAISGNNVELDPAKKDQYVSGFEISDVVNTQAINAKTPDKDNTFGYIWLSDAATIDFSVDDMVNPKRTTQTPSHDVFVFDEWVTDISVQSNALSNTPYQLEFDTDSLPTNNNLYATYQLASNYKNHGGTHVRVPAGFAFPYQGKTDRSVAEDYWLSKLLSAPPAGLRWVEVLEALNKNDNELPYRGYELDKTFKLDAKFSQDLALVSNPTVVESPAYKQIVRDSVRVYIGDTADASNERKIASTDKLTIDSVSEAVDGYISVTITYEDPLYEDTTPALEYTYRVFVGSGLPDVNNVVYAIELPNTIQSVYEKDSATVAGIKSDVKGKAKVKNFSNTELAGSNVDVEIYKVDGTKVDDATLEKGHYLVKASVSNSSGVVVAASSYAITVDPVISDADGVDKDITPFHLVTSKHPRTPVDSSKALLPTRELWEYATRFQISKTTEGSHSEYAFAYFDSSASTQSGLGLTLSGMDEWVEADTREEKVIGSKTYFIVTPVLMDRTNNSLVTVKSFTAEDTEPTAGYRTYIDRLLS